MINTPLSWADTIPDGWRVLSLKRVCTFYTGWTPPTGDADAYEGDNLWANISDLGERTVRNTAKRISDEAVARHGMSIARAGSLLFSFKLSVGQVSFAGVDMYTNEAIATFPPTAQLDLGFAYYAFPEMIVRNASENIYGAKMLNQQLINAAPLIVPPAEEQTAIATFLDRQTAKIDALVEEQRRLIELLKEKRQAVISHAVTKGLDPNAKMVPSGVEWLGDVPAHWEVHPLKYLTRFESGGTPSKANPDFWEGDIPWLSAKDLKSERLSDTIDHITTEALAEGAASLVPASAVVVLVRGMMLARAFPVVQLDVPMAINQDLKALVRSRLRPDYLAWTLRGLEAESLSRIDEAGHGTKALRMEAWTSMEIPAPPPGEQESITRYLVQATGRLDKLSSEVASALELLQERRSALISAAVTGKIDVRDYVDREGKAA